MNAANGQAGGLRGDRSSGFAPRHAGGGVLDGPLALGPAA